jgi:cell division protein FtsW
MDLLKKLFKGDKVIWVIFFLLCMISIIEVFSASSSLTYGTGNHWKPVAQHTSILLVGTLIILLVHNINYRYFQVGGIILYPISAVVLLFVLASHKINGASRWLSVFGIQFQPSEIAKMALIICVAFILARSQESDGTLNKKAFPSILSLTIITCLLIFPENFSTSALLFCVIMIMMFIGHIQLRKIIYTILGAVGLGVILITVALLMPQGNKNIGMHRMSTWQGRIAVFKSHNQDVPAAQFDIEHNNQVAHANIAIATSNIIGKMPGNSTQRDFLAQAYSDFIFAIIIEELGLLGGLFVVILYVWLLIRAGRIAKKARGNFASTLVMGLTLMMVSQALLNMCVAVGLLPVTGQTLPFISKGGTSTIVNCIYLGMILSVSRYTQSSEAEKHDGITPNIDDSNITKETLESDDKIINGE